MRVRVGTQNMTEGPVTEALRRCDAVALQEIPHRSAIIGGFGKGWRFYFPEHDSHQCLGWRTEVFNRAGEGESWRFHRSGKADPKIPDKIRTPSRWLHMQPLMVEGIEVPFDLYGTWAINSWNPFRADQWTDERRWLFVDKTWPVITREMEASDELGHLALLGGDLNSVRARLGIAGFRSFPVRGLDRQFYPRDPRVELVDWWFGPKTGKGGQHRHKLLVADYEITKGGKR